jgi:hypothetical protein
MTAPVDPSASTAASLLAGTVLGGPDELAAWPGLARLVTVLHQTATADSTLHAALEAVSAAPEDPSRVAALAYAVDAVASRDSGLRGELARLLDQARQHRRPSLTGSPQPEWGRWWPTSPHAIPTSLAAPTCSTSSALVLHDQGDLAARPQPARTRPSYPRDPTRRQP